MRLDPRAFVAVLLCELLVLLPACHKQVRLGAPAPAAPPQAEPLQKEILKAYLTLFESAPEFHYTDSQINRLQEHLEKSQDYCVAQFKGHARKYKSELQQVQAELKNRGPKLDDGERHAMHCQIQQLRVLESQATVLAQNAIPTAYQNRLAKLELIQQWPAQLKQINQEIASGAYHNRKWGDVKDIGFREIASGQQNDIKVGQEAIKQMKQAGMMPPEVKDRVVVDYVNTVAQQVALHSDLKVPLHVMVLNSKEINAFALPGGYIFVERGLLEAADDESELAGVIAHEVAHVTARHSHKLMKKATIAGILYQAAQIAALVFTGGVSGIGTYYALQYGFYGLGLVLSLDLLGVSREYELQADQLGVQYAWNADYDPSGFIRFFDKIATKVGYVNGVSWFRTHPPFYTRMVDAQQEIMFLPKKAHYVVNTDGFRRMKKELKAVKAEADKEAKNKPTLYDFGKAEGCPTPKHFEFKSDEPIEKLCQSPKLVTPEEPGLGGISEPSGMGPQ